MRTILIFLISVIYIVVTSVKSIAQVSDIKAGTKTSSGKTGVKSSQDTTDLTPDSQNQKSKQKGQIYIGKNWSTGTIVLRDGGVIDNYYLRYNLLADQLEFIAGKDTLVFTNPKVLNTVTFGGHTFIYENYLSDTTIRAGYFELIVPGKNKLILKRTVKSQKPDAKFPDDKSLIKYKVDECYFISKPGLPANKLACNRKSVLTFLNDHNEDIAEYLRITGNKVRNIEDLKLLVSYYNSLDEEY